MSETELKARPFEGKWSTLEILIHIADAELIGSCRIRQALAEHTDDYPYYIQDKWAKDLNYQGFSMDELDSCLELFRYLRACNSILFAKMDESDWSKKGIHPERGEMNVRELLELYADHSERHIDQIAERRELLNNPHSMELILKDRLY